MNYADILASSLRSPKPLSRAMQQSVMAKPETVAPAWRPENDAIESVSPEDWIPNPKSLMMGLAGVVGKGSEKLFAKTLADALRGPEWKSRSQVVNMPIDRFLEMAEPLPVPNEGKLARVKQLMSSGTPFETLPFLIMNNPREAASKVVGHEGRHRALALRDQGYTHMPVEMRGDIRWSEQMDPQTFDYRAEWPTELIGEGGARRPFPLPREKATAAFPEVWE